MSYNVNRRLPFTAVSEIETKSTTSKTLTSMSSLLVII